MVVLPVLHPLEVADRHAAGVGQNVGQHDHAGLVEDLVGVGLIGALAASMMIGALIAAAFSAVITPPSAAGISTSTSSSSSSLVRDPLGLGIALQQPFVLDGVVAAPGNVEAVGAVVAAASSR